MTRANRSSLLGISVALAAPILALAVAFSGCASAPREPLRLAASQSPFWEVNGGPAQGTLYLLGSIHVAARRPIELDAAIEQAFRRSEQLLVEVDPTEVSFTRIMREMLQRHGTLAPLEPLAARVSGEILDLLRRYARERGLDLRIVERLRPWALFLVVESLEIERAGFAHARGVDAYFLRLAAESKKEIIGLEDVLSQLRMLSTLSDRSAERLLVGALRSSAVFADTGRATLEALTDAWERGDLPALERLAFPSLGAQEDAEFYEAAYFRRNQEMAASLAGRMRGGRTLFCVVGTAHLVGERSIVAILRDRGYQVGHPAAVERPGLARRPKPSGGS